MFWKIREELDAMLTAWDNRRICKALDRYVMRFGKELLYSVVHFTSKNGKTYKVEITEE